MADSVRDGDAVRYRFAKNRLPLTALRRCSRRLTAPAWLGTLGQRDVAVFSKEGPMAAAPCRILVVDDNRDAADTQAALLQADGHEIRVASSAAAALAMADQIKPEVALLDLAMPLGDGYSLAKELQKRFPLCRVIAVSGYGTAEFRERSRQSGFRYHLLKPVEPSALAKIVQEECEDAKHCES